MQKGKKIFKDTIILIGKTMVKIDTMTTCPWINYQPRVPDAVNKLRKK